MRAEESSTSRRRRVSEPLGKADLQIHTADGDGEADARQLFDYVEGETDLDVIAVTDHDDLGGALRAREVWAQGRYSFDLILGVEVSTRSGHLLGIFLREPVSSFRRLEETIDAIHRQGGLVIVPHPFAWLTRSVGERALNRLLERGPRPDAIEVTNATFAARLTAERARRCNRQRYHLAETGGSDAHFLMHVGSAYTRFRGATAEELRRELLAGRTAGELGPRPRPLTWRQIAEQAWRGYAVTPRKVVGPRLKRWLRR